MRFERLERERARVAVGAMIGGVLVVGAVLAAIWLRLGLPRPVCLFREWSGLPCPTCGSTRLVEALVSGDLRGAAASNPLVFAALSAIALWSIGSAVRLVLGLPAWRVVLSPGERRVLLILLAGLLAAGWAYLIWRGS